MAQIRELGEQEWEVLRRLRLRALADAPEAFGSSLERELAFDEATWRGRLANPTSGNFVALDGSEPVGLATGIHLDHLPTGERLLVGMWVAPERRRHGLGRALVEAVASWAVADGATRLRLGVEKDNTAAQHLYASCGFVPTGVAEPLRERPDLVEVEMARDLYPAAT